MKFEEAFENTISTIVEKSQTNAINVTTLLLRLIRGYTMEKSQTNAVNAILQPHRQAFEDSFENTPKKKFNKCKQCNCILTGRLFEDTFEDAPWRKIQKMQPM